MSSPPVGLLATSRAFRSLKIPDLISANIKLKERQRGCSDAEHIETLVLLQTAGGECPEDLQLLAGDSSLETSGNAPFVATRPAMRRDG